MALIIWMALTLILSVSGCITNNANVSTPTPRPISTTTPSPTSTHLASDNIIGLWEGSKNSISTSIQFLKDGSLIYNEGGNIATGAWEKIDKKQYRIGILISDTVITLNDNMNQFYWGDIILTKKA